VKGKIYFESEYKDKLHAPKWDSLQIHDGRKNVDKNLRRLKKGEWFMIKDCKHAKNENVFSCKGKNLSQPHFRLSVRMKLTLPKLGIWSPPGLPNV